MSLLYNKFVVPLRYNGYVENKYDKNNATKFCNNMIVSKSLLEFKKGNYVNKGSDRNYSIDTCNKSFIYLERNWLLVFLSKHEPKLDIHVDILTIINIKLT